MTAQDAIRPLLHDRREAGRRLAERLVQRYRGRKDVIVLALPRGGVPVGDEIARALQAPLDVFMVHKLRFPGQEEMAIGAITTAGIRLLNEFIISQKGLRRSEIEVAAEDERQKLRRREVAYRDGRPAPELHDKTVILADDDLATGVTMKAAVETIKEESPACLVVAVPIGPPATCAKLKSDVNDLICLHQPRSLPAAGQGYAVFDQVSDEEVCRCLRNAP